MSDQTSTIPKGWKMTTLGKVADKITKGTTPTTIGGEFVKAGINFIKAESINDDGTFMRNKFSYINQEIDNRMVRSRLAENDILFSIAGVIGRVAIVTKKILPANINQALAIIRPTSGEIYFKYLFYFLLDPRQKALANSGVAQSVQANVNLAQVGDIKMSLPSLSEQHAIAAVLSSLDDKIELLREQNKTLEATAQAIFKEWFEDFNFPNATGKMIDSELGKIPEGWRVGKIEDLCKKLASGGTPSTSNTDYYGGNIDWFSTKELQDDYIFASDKKITKEGLENSSAKIFPKGSIVMAIYAAPTVGRLGILGKEATFNQAACGFVANEEICSNEYVYLLLHFLRDAFNGLANGAAQQNLNVGLVKNFAITLPQKTVMDQFNLVIVPIFQKILNNTSQIQTLSTLRDTLLPKLMKGEVRVKGFNG